VTTSEVRARPRARWLLPIEPDSALVERLQEELHLPRAICRLLALRGYSAPDDAKTYLRPRLDQLHEPNCLTDLDRAVERITRALRESETILVHGDYDVDGMCSTTLMVRAIAALGGLLGLKSGDTVLGFPIAELAAQGPIALAHWVRGIFTNAQSRTDWLAHLGGLLGAVPGTDRVSFTLGSAAVVLGLKLDTGASGNPRLTPTLGVELGNATARVQAAAELFRIDLVSGAAVALPSLGVWAAAGNAANRVLDLTAPTVARADTLRVGFGLDPQRKLVFVLAADGVQLGSHSYPTLDLTSPDAVLELFDRPHPFHAEVPGELPQAPLVGCAKAADAMPATSRCRRHSAPTR